MSKDTGGTPESDAALDARLADWGRLARSATATVPMPELPPARVRRPVRLGWQLAAGMLAVALAAAITVGLPRMLGRDSGPLGGVTSTASPPPGFQVVTFHGLSITVPASWPVAGYTCQLTGSVVELPGFSPACGRPLYPDLTIVTFGGGQQLEPGQLSRTSRTTISGLPATRVEGSMSWNGQQPGRPAFGFVVPKLHASVLIMPARGQTGQELADSVRVDAVDMHGCRSMAGDVSDLPRSATSDQAGMAQALIPGEPASASVCRYQAGWLEQGARLTGAALRSFAATVNRLPAGLSRASALGLTKCRPPGATGSSDDELARDSEAYRIEVGYPSGPPVVLLARLGQCGDLGISNGVRTGQRTDELSMALIRLVGEVQGWPGNVVPAP